LSQGVDNRFESSSTYDMIIGQHLLGKLGKITNIDDHTVARDPDNIPMEVLDYHNP
jgi:hypothetical protein